MKNFTLALLFVSFVFGSMSLLAQEKSPQSLRNCGTDEYNASLLPNNPKMMGSEAYENLMASKIAVIKAELQANPNRALQFIIPVVVHVIHNGEPIGVGANISDAQVISQIQVMNEDFRRLAGTRGSNTNSVGADVEVEFCLAKQTPDGCITNGIDRLDMSSVNTSWSTGNINSVLKPATIWDAALYMNMWSVNFSDNTLLGYAQFPGGPANTDGVVANYTYFGSNDAAGVTIPGSYNLGRTMTHEVGHYVGLFHTFQGGCNGAGDQCADTPAVATPNFGCPTNANSCPSAGADMVSNYMDYTNDACMNVFTMDQKARVIATMTNAANRPNTAVSNVCTELASVNSDGSVKINGLNSGSGCSNEITPNIRIQNWGTVTLTSATLAYDIDGGSSNTYTWNGSLEYGAFVDLDLPLIAALGGSHTYNVSIANPNGNADQRACNDLASSNFNGIESYASTSEIRLTIVPDNYGSETEWEFRDENDVLFTGGPYTNNNSDPINEVFNVVPNKCYTFTIFDAYEDGICCSYGTGSYSLKTDDDTVIFAGAQFADSESTRISTLTLSITDYFAEGAISLYPNPVSNQLNIKIGNTNDLPDSYEIFNMLGQSLTKKEIHGNADLNINSSHFSNGMYFIRISKDAASVTLPFVKK